MNKRQPSGSTRWHPGQLVAAPREQQTDGEGHRRDHQRAHMRGTVTRMYACQYRGQLAVARHGEQDAGDGGLPHQRICQRGNNEGGECQVAQRDSAGTLGDLIERGVC